MWPRHGHLRGILNGYQRRQPNFHKWARPAYERGVLGDVTTRVLPGDKIYQAMEIEPELIDLPSCMDLEPAPRKDYPCDWQNCTVWHGAGPGAAQLGPLVSPIAFEALDTCQQIYTGTAASDSQTSLDRLVSGRSGCFCWKKSGRRCPHARSTAASAL